ncbi:aldehyde dehydrogenase family protein [Arthrobacter sp. JUb115]|uniref:aldehyde dehydrogenase family protein n=1 Tax=Arthrobacter sp. JUb115 TaxID=2485108 RepID=UPI00105E987F|nr:aldehyde dehydrogenase family protein [Arthrobacter sp. JUb115]TDU30622.1 aldehyde dehydrogenase (NAD+) [Arthrobacter sp. JUb115]
MNLSTTLATLEHCINGAWVPGEGRRIDSKAAADDSIVLAEGTAASVDQVDAAFGAAHRAKKSWASTPMAARGAILAKAAGYLKEHAEDFGAELAAEEGKTRAEGIGEVLRAAQILAYYSGEAERAAGTVFQSPRAGEQILVTHKPLGVIGVITPFNFPIGIPAWKIAPALVFGNTVVFKPASLVPLLAMRFVQALEHGGLPAGVLNLVIGPGALGDAFIANEHLDGLTFTGSTGVGRKLCAAGAARGIPVQAEMGGKNASVVLADADLDLASEQVLFGAFRSTGQKCTATSRLILDESIADAFLAKLTERLEQWVTGDPLDPSVHMGPLVDAKAANSAAQGIDRSLAQGATLRYRGLAPGTGSFLAPTILELPEGEAGRANCAWQEEFFAPIVSVRRVNGWKEAFEAAEDSEYGLSLALFTSNLALALEAQQTLDVGILHVNSESAGADPHVPFGGAKASGYGPKEQGAAAREFYTHTTTTYLRG